MQVAVAVAQEIDTSGSASPAEAAKTFAEALHAKWGVGRAECQVRVWKVFVCLSVSVSSFNAGCAERSIDAGKMRGETRQGNKESCPHSLVQDDEAFTLESKSFPACFHDVSTSAGVLSS